jgi:hypothetical protein
VTQRSAGDTNLHFPIGAVLSKGKARIYLLTHHGQTSGVDGGRFGEISEYVAPWMKVASSWACYAVFTKIPTPVTGSLSRVDLFFDSRTVSPGEDPNCKTLHSPTQTPVWFGSYVTRQCLKSSPSDDRICNGFFLPFPLGRRRIESPNDEMVFTATWNTQDPASLPLKNDKELTRFLREAANIVSSIKYK